jgi:endonuclease YncB( thermonuclease family)
MQTKRILRTLVGVSTFGFSSLRGLFARHTGVGRRVGPRGQTFLGALALLFAASWLWDAPNTYVAAYQSANGVVISTATRAPLGDELFGLAVAAGSDTITIDGYLVRLKGIDGFENTQSCIHNGERTYRCADVGRALLAEWVGTGVNTHCLVDSTDHWGRVWATCSTNGKDLAAQLVHAGYALALPGAKGANYALAMEAARETRMGAWAGPFMEPWNARQGTAPN